MLRPAADGFRGDLREPERLMGNTDPMAAPCREKLANSRGLLCMIDPERADDSEYFPLIYPNFVNLSKLTRGEGGGPHVAAYPMSFTFGRDDRDVPTVMVYLAGAEIYRGPIA